MGYNLAEIHEAIAGAVGERDCLVHGERRLSWNQVTDRTRRLANALLARGIEPARPRAELSGWQSGQDHVALYLFNGCEYLEGMLGSYKAGAVPFNVNYRYTSDELISLFNDARPRVCIYHAELAPTLAVVREHTNSLEILIQVADDSGNDLLPGAIEYEEFLAGATATRPDIEWSADDLYMLYTGGTTGAPKGVLWRQHDIFIAALGGRRRDGTIIESMDELVERARARHSIQLPTPPMMHGAAHWASFVGFHSGGTVVMQENVHRLVASDVLGTAARERVTSMLIVGDAFAQPLLDELATNDYDLSSLDLIATGGAPMSGATKARLLERLPHIILFDAVGASESGSQAVNMSTKNDQDHRTVFAPRPGAGIAAADRESMLPRADHSLGWLAQTGYIPLGYLNDEARTARTFPLIGDARYSVPGDRARWTEDGRIELLGREAVTINSGGEKIFAEEVEHALKTHPAVYDVIVCGRPSTRWGQEVCAIVRLRTAVDEAALLDTAAEKLARYKLPKAFLFVDEIVRHPNGKADYRWAKKLLAEATATE